MGILSSLGRMVKPKPKMAPKAPSPAMPGRGDGWMRTEWEANRQLRNGALPQRGVTSKGGDPYNMTGGKLTPSKPKNLRKK